MVGVGIEPTFRAFQTRANPSQLSDRLERAVRLELTIPDLQSGALAAWRRAREVQGPTSNVQGLCDETGFGLWTLDFGSSLERKERFELSNRVWKTRMFPATSLPQNNLVGEDRVELSPRVPRTRMLTLHHTPFTKIGAPGETRTHNPLLKRQVP